MFCLSSGTFLLRFSGLNTNVPLYRQQRVKGATIAFFTRELLVEIVCIHGTTAAGSGVFTGYFCDGGGHVARFVRSYFTYVDDRAVSRIDQKG